MDIIFYIISQSKFEYIEKKNIKISIIYQFDKLFENPIILYDANVSSFELHGRGDVEVDAPRDIYYRNEGSSRIIMRRAAFLCNA